MSLTTTGVWQPGVWASTVWADGVWYESGGVAPPVVVVEPSGVRRRPFRVRRADFSSQENYELALRAALSDAKFAIRELQDEPSVQEKPKRGKSKAKAIPVDKSLSADMDREIRVSADAFVELQRAAELEEREMLLLFIKTIEEDW